MQPLLKQKSLMREFIFLAGFILLAVVILSAWFTWRMYNVHTETIIQRLKTQASRIERTFTDNIGYTSYLMDYMGTQIRDHGDPEDYKFIQGLMASYRMNPEVNNRLPWTMFSWADANQQLIINSDQKVDKPISIKHREYAHHLITDPWKMQFTKMSFGLVSHKWILPVGMGVTDDGGNYWGSVLFGINLRSLSQMLEQSTNAVGVYFAIVDSDMQVVADSREHYIGEDSHILQTLEHIDMKQALSGVSSKLSLFGDSDGYSVYQKFPKYPFTLVVSYDKELSRQEIWKLLFSRITEFVVIGIVAFCMLALLHVRIVAPILQLSNAADAISHGDTRFQLPKSDHYEIVNLNQKLTDISAYLTQIQLVSKDLEEKTVELKQAKEDAEEAKEIAERANAAKSDFLANMSHELRTPLNAVINLAAVLLMGYYGQLQEKQKEYISDIKNAGEDLLKLINDILDLSKAEAGKFQLDEEVVDIKDVVARCEVLASEAAMNKNVRIVNDTRNIALPMLWGDELKLKQIIVNLLSNAIKFTPPEKRITLSAGIYNDEFYISVADEGVGIAEKDIPLVLEKYGQAQNPYKRVESQGTGLGLPLVQKLVEAHQGRFDLRSRLNHGTVVTIYMPPSRIIRDRKVKEKEGVRELEVVE